MPNGRVSMLLLLALTVGCTANNGSSSEPTPPSRSDALALVGQWLVDADGEAPGAAISLGEEMTLFLSCGVLDGEWKADGEQSLFVASSAAGDDSCFAGSQRHALAWLEAAVSFRVDGDNRLLLDKDGGTVALLRPGANPTVGPNRSKDIYEKAPTVSPSMAAAAQDAQPLPAGTVSVTAHELTRRWVPSGVAASTPAEVTFRSDGAWTGSDGCNGEGGSYVLGRAGRLLATTGPSTAIGCQGAPVGGWLAQAARAGLVRDQLVLYDRAGNQLGAFAPSSA